MVLLGIDFVTLYQRLTSLKHYLPQPHRWQRCQAITPGWFRLGPSSLAATKGVTCCFFFLGVLRCFNSPGSLL